MAFYMMRRGCFLLLNLIAILLFMVPSASAQPEDDLTINVSQEYGGFYKPGRWYPLVVTFDNRPSEGRPGDRSLDFIGRVTVTAASKDGRESGYEFFRDVTVPAFSVQRFVLYVKLPEDVLSPVMTVRNENGRKVKEIPLEAVTPLGKDQTLLVKVQKNSARIGFPNPRTGNVNPITEASMPPNNLPELWAAYDPVDILVFPEWPETQINPDQTQAILDWVAMGGTVVFLGGANSGSYGAAGDSRLLPVETSSSSQFQITSTGSFLPVADGANMVEARGFLISNMEPKLGSEVIWEADGGDGRPILVRRPHGEGQLLFFGLDFESTTAPLVSAAMPYWLSVIPLPNITDWEHAFSFHRKKTKTVTRGAARAPNIILIILICFLYMAAVGPLNFYLLGRYNKVQYAWLTVPAIVFLFSGLIYTFGTITKGGKYIGREITLYMGRADQPYFDERSLISIFTPEADSFYVRAKQQNQTVADSDRWHLNEKLFGILSFEDLTQGTASAFGFQTSNPAIRSEDDSIHVASWPLRTFDAAQFELRGPKELDGSLIAEVDYFSEGRDFWIEGIIENDTGLDFYQTGIFYAGRVLPTDALGQGEDFDLTRENTTRPIELGERDRHRWVGINEAISDFAPSQGKDTDADINRENAQEILRALFRPQNSGSLLPPLDGKFYFVGLAEDPELTVETNFDRNQGARSIVLLAELNPTPKSEQFIVPSSGVQVRLQEYSGERGQFQIVQKDSYEEDALFEIVDSFGILSVEMPFQHPEMEPVFVRNNVYQIPNQTTQEFAIGGYSFAESKYTVFESGLLRNFNSTYVTPYSGRAWIQIQSQEPEEKKPGGGIGFGMTAQTQLDRIWFEMGGIMPDEE